MSDSGNSVFWAYVALSIGILTLGFSAIFVRWANAPGIVTSFYRMGIAVAILAWPFFRGRKSQGRLPKQGRLMAILGGVFFAGDLAAWSSGVMLGGATNPTLLANTAPLWVGLGALVIFRERLKPLFWFGLILAMAGAAVVLGIDAQQATSLGVGSLLGLVAAFFYGAYFLFTQRGRESLNSLSYFWVAASSSTVTLLLFSLILGQPLVGYSTTSYLNFLALGIVTQVIGYLAMTYALGKLPASIVSPTMLGQPIVTAFLAGPLLGESFTRLQILGGIAVLVGVFIVHRSRSNETG